MTANNIEYNGIYLNRSYTSVKEIVATLEYNNTIDREIFVVKIFWSTTFSDEIKHMKYFV